jgi:predicted nucleic acid-binding protein
LSVVVDSNLLVALALNDPRAPAVDRQFRAWIEARETLPGPELLRYEAANALTRAVMARQVAADQVVAAVRPNDRNSPERTARTRKPCR